MRKLLIPLTIVLIASCAGSDPGEGDDDLGSDSEELIGLPPFPPRPSVSISGMTPTAGPVGTVVTLSGVGLSHLACQGGAPISQYFLIYGLFPQAGIPVGCTFDAATGNIRAIVPSTAVDGEPFRIWVLTHQPPPCFDSCNTWSLAASSAVFGLIPTAPSNLVARAVSGSEIDLGWQDNSANETGFEIWMNDGTWRSLGTVPANHTSEPITQLATAGHTYSFELRAVGASGDSPFSNVASATTFANPTITVINSPTVPSPLANGPVPASAITGASAFFDANGNGVLDTFPNDIPSDPLSIFPFWVPQSGPSFGRILRGNRFSGNANLVVAISFTGAGGVSQFVAVHFRLVGTTIASGPMLAGDTSGVNPAELFGTTPVSASLTAQLGVNGVPTRLTGTIDGTAFASDSVGTIFGSEVRLTIDLPVLGE